MTTYATDVYSGTGSQVEFAVTFDFIQRDHVKVYRIENSDQAETELTQTDTNPTGDEYQWQSNILIEVGTAPTTEQKLRIDRDTPEDEQIVQWNDGSYIVADDLNTSDLQWLYGLQELEDKFSRLQTTAIKYLGAIDLTVDEAPADPSGGEFYINTGSGTVVDSWTGINGDDVVGSEQVIYNADLEEWEIFGVPSSQVGVVEVQGTAPIGVDATDTQRPVVSIAAATVDDAGSMSAADKEKLDGIAADATVGIPDAPSDGEQYARQDAAWTALTAGIPDAPSDGEQYARQDAAWTALTSTDNFVRNDIDNTYAGLISATGNEAFGVPVGTTAEQPTNADGLLRYNSTLDRYEGSSNGSWGALGGGATGGGSDRVFQLNTMVCTTDFTLPDGESALSAGPIEIEDGVTITINDDSSWVIL